MSFLRPSAIEIASLLTQLVDDAGCYPGHVLLQPLDAGDDGGEEGLQVGGGQQPALVQHLDTEFGHHYYYHYHHVNFIHRLGPGGQERAPGYHSHVDIRVEQNLEQIIDGVKLDEGVRPRIRNHMQLYNKIFTLF